MRTVIVTVLALAAPAAADPEHPITAAQRTAAITQVAAALEQHYVFPDQGRAIGQTLRTRLAHGDYGAAATGEQLAQAITRDVVARSHDRHFELRYVDAPPPSQGGNPEPDDAAEQRYLNYGVFEVRRLRFNLGYLSFNVFGRPTAQAGDKIAAAMRVVADTAGLIVDLRDCHGGDTDTVALAQSYLVPADTHLIDLYTRDDGKTEHVRAAAQLGGPRYASDKPVFVLVGPDTASGCEAFAYGLQARHRATVIGGHTAGAAHFGQPYPAGDHFMVFVANGRPIDPITHGDWEGTGVIPTVAVEPARALDAGELALLRALAPHEASPRRQAAMQQRITELTR